MQQFMGSFSTQQYLDVLGSVFGLVLLAYFRSIGRGMAVRHAPVHHDPSPSNVRVYQVIWFAAGLICLTTSALDFLGLLR